MSASSCKTSITSQIEVVANYILSYCRGTRWACDTSFFFCSCKVNLLTNQEQKSQSQYKNKKANRLT